MGLSNVTVEELERAAQIVPISSVQNRYNLNDRRSEAVLRACERSGIAFMPWLPLGTGRLARPGGKLCGIASHHGATVPQVALAWLLAKSPVTLPIPDLLGGAPRREPRRRQTAPDRRRSSVAHLTETLARRGTIYSDSAYRRQEGWFDARR